MSKVFYFIFAIIKATYYNFNTFGVTFNQKLEDVCLMNKYKRCILYQSVPFIQKCFITQKKRQLFIPSFPIFCRFSDRRENHDNAKMLCEASKGRLFEPKIQQQQEDVIEKLNQQQGEAWLGIESEGAIWVYTSKKV